MGQNFEEQLGGYEKARTELKIVKIQKSSRYSSDDIEQSLLQYRRDNNVFEVGDFVVDTEGFLTGCVRLII